MPVEGTACAVGLVQVGDKGEHDNMVASGSMVVYGSDRLVLPPFPTPGTGGSATDSAMQR